MKAMQRFALYLVQSPEKTHHPGGIKEEEEEEVITVFWNRDFYPINAWN